MPSEQNYVTNWKNGIPRAKTFMGKVREISRYAAISLLASTNFSVDEKFVRCIYCHNVFDDQKEKFEKLILKLKSIGHFIDTETLLDFIERKKNIEKKYFHLSFDDGFRNNFKNAFPILKKYKVPAIFFVPSGIIESDFESQKKYCLETTEYSANIELVKWEDLREMVSSGYQVGSHTKTHVRFSKISSDINLLTEEIYVSKKEIESKLGVECKYISWPYGNLTDIDKTSVNLIKKFGYNACFGAYRGTVKLGTTDKFNIPRHQFELHWPDFHIQYFFRGNFENTKMKI